MHFRFNTILRTVVFVALISSLVGCGLFRNKKKCPDCPDFKNDNKKGKKGAVR